jgi:DNA mismatch repair protein MutL
MQTACKSAIKGEDDLSQSEINILVEQIFSQISELFCPHGRPIAVKLSKKEIEKWFKRIV